MKTPNFVQYLILVVSSFFLFVVFLPRIMPSLETVNTATLHDGWEVIVEANGPVDLLAYSKNSKEGSVLYDDSGVEVLRTLPETIPGNFAGKASVVAGTYTLKGEPTTLLFSGENLVSINTPESLKADIQLGFFSWVMFILVMGLAFRAWSREPKKL